MAELKGVIRAVALLRAELHSLALTQATIVIEVSNEQWHTLRRNAAAADAVDQLELTGGDGTSGPVFVRPRRGGIADSISVDQLGLVPVTLERKVEQLEGLVRKLLELKVPAAVAFPALERVEAFARLKGYAEQLGADLATVKEKLKALEPLTPHVGPLVNINGVGETFDKHHDRMDRIERRAELLDAAMVDLQKRLAHAGIPR